MDMKALMKQANAMQKQLKKIEEELDATQYEGSNNGVKVVINGKNEVQSVEIDPDLLEKDNQEMLQDLILISVNDAVKKAADDRTQKMGAVTGGISVPGF